MTAVPMMQKRNFVDRYRCHHHDHHHHHHLCLRSSTNNKRSGGSAAAVSFFFSSWNAPRGYDITHDSSVTATTNSFPGRDHIPCPPKIILEGYGSTGFDVLHVIRRATPTTGSGDGGNGLESNESSLQQRQQQDQLLTASTSLRESGVLHMMGSIVVFPHACFFWKGVTDPTQIRAELLLAPMLLYRPALEYLLIGYNCPSTNRMKPEQSDSTESSSPAHVMNQQVQQMRTILKEHHATHPRLQVHRPSPMVVELLSVANAMGTFNILNAEDRQVAAALIIDPYADEIEQDK